MGYRTIVMLNNDHSSEWENDPELGKKIIRSAQSVGDGLNERHAKDELKHYGRVVQCVHADTQTIAVLDGYTFFDVLGTNNWAPNQSKEEVFKELLKKAADQLGYRLVKKADKKEG